MTTLSQHWWREWFLAGRLRLWLVPMAGFVALAMLFPLALRGNRDALHLAGPLYIWCCALLATFLHTERMYALPWESGGLHAALLKSSVPLLPRGLEMVLARSLAWWLRGSAPIAPIAALVTLSYGLPLEASLAALVALLPASLAFTVLGGFASAVTLGRGGLLVAILVLPLSIPVLLTGFQCLLQALNGHAWSSDFFSLLALCALLVVALPFATSASLCAHCE